MIALMYSDTAQPSHSRLSRSSGHTYPTAYAAFLIFLFSVPTFAGVLRHGNLYVGAILQVSYAAALLLLLAGQMLHRPVNRTHVLVPLFLALFFFTLIALAAARDVVRTIPADLLELHKPVFALIIFITTVLIRWDGFAVERVARAYLFLVAIMGIYCVAEALGGPPAHAVSTLLYKSAKPVLQGKATGTFGQTYVLGAFMIFGTLFSGALLAYTRRLRYLPIAIVSLGSMVLSQSRAAVLAFVFMTLCVGLTYGLYRNFRHKIVVYASGILLFAFVAVVFDRALDLFQHLPYLYAGISRLLAHGVHASGSFNDRYEQLLFAVESQDAIPLLGVGIGKGYMRLLESYYAMYLYRYGAIGIALSLTVFYLFFRHSLVAFNRSLEEGRVINACFFVALHLWMYAFPILALSSAFHDQGKFAVFFYGSLAIMMSYNRQWRQARGTVRDERYSRPIPVGQ